MTFGKTILSLACAAALGTGLVTAAAANDAALAARKGNFQLYAFHVGLLGAMARGDVAYDAEAASTAASNLAAIASIDWTPLWVEGTDNASIANTRALPAIWSDREGFDAIKGRLAAATADLAENAGTGLDAVRAGLGAVGQNCQACHQTYRAPQ